MGYQDTGVKIIIQAAELARDQAKTLQHVPVLTGKLPPFRIGNPQGMLPGPAYVHIQGYIGFLQGILQELIVQYTPPPGILLLDIIKEILHAENIRGEKNGLTHECIKGRFKSHKCRAQQVSRSLRHIQLPDLERTVPLHIQGVSFGPGDRLAHPVELIHGACHIPGFQQNDRCILRVPRVFHLKQRYGRPDSAKKSLRIKRVIFQEFRSFSCISGRIG